MSFFPPPSKPVRCCSSDDEPNSPKCPRLSPLRIRRQALDPLLLPPVPPGIPQLADAERPVARARGDGSCGGWAASCRAALLHRLTPSHVGGPRSSRGLRHMRSPRPAGRERRPWSVVRPATILVASGPRHTTTFPSPERNGRALHRSHRCGVRKAERPPPPQEVGSRATCTGRPHRRLQHEVPQGRCLARCCATHRWARVAVRRARWGGGRLGPRRTLGVRVLHRGEGRLPHARSGLKAARHAWRRSAHDLHFLSFCCCMVPWSRVSGVPLPSFGVSWARGGGCDLLCDTCAPCAYADAP